MDKIDLENANNVEVMPGVYFTSKQTLAKSNIATRTSNLDPPKDQENTNSLDMSSAQALIASIPGGPLAVATLKDNLNFYKLSLKQLVKSQEELGAFLLQEEFKDDPIITEAINENHGTLSKFVHYIKTIQEALKLVNENECLE